VVNYPLFPVSLSFLVEVVGACNSKGIRARGLEFESWRARLNKIVAAHSNIHVCGMMERHASEGEGGVGELNWLPFPVSLSFWVDLIAIYNSIIRNKDVMWTLTGTCFNLV
jgi:hypothetical protein